MRAPPVRRDGNEDILNPARWIGSRRLLLPLAARVICARLVEESATFFRRELSRPDGVFAYHLRGEDSVVNLRHSVQDGATLAEVFHQHDYVPGPELEKAIGDPRRILDLGANIGLFGVFATSRWPRAEIVAYEADPDNADVHERTIAANGLTGRWRLHRMAAGAHDGEVELAAGFAMGSFVVSPGSDPGVPTIQVPMRDVLAEVCGADLVKLDIEGGEWEIICDPRFQQKPPRVIVLEYHPHLGPGGDPRSAAETALRNAGLRIVPIWHRDDGYGMVWAWRD
jgi:FkbM family methyltransferase